MLLWEVEIWVMGAGGGFCGRGGRLEGWVSGLWWGRVVRVHVAVLARCYAPLTVVAIGGRAGDLVLEVEFA